MMQEGLDGGATARIVEIIEARGEPLPIEVLAQRFYEEESGREVLPFPARPVSAARRRGAA